MSSTELQDGMIQYCIIESKSEDDAASDKSLPDGKESQATIEDNNSSQINEIEIPSTETNGEESNSTKNGIYPSTQIVSYVESLKQNCSLILEKVNMSNGESKNGLQISSVENDGPEKDVNNGLGVHYGETTVKEISNNDDVSEDKPQKSKEVDTSMLECEKSSNSFSLSSTSSLTEVQIPSVGDNGTEKDINNGLGVHNKETVKEISNNIEDVSEDKPQKNKGVDTSILECEKSTNSFSLIGTSSLTSNFRQNEDLKQDFVIKTADQQKDGLKGLEVLDLVTKGAGSDKDEYHSSSDASVTSIRLSSEPTDSKPLKQFTEQVLQYLNSSEMQSKIKEINNLIEHVASSSFKPPTIAVGDEIKTDGHEDSHDIESEIEEKSKLDDDGLTLPKRKSKQSEFEDPEEQLLAKKLKMSTIVNNALEEQSSEEARSCVIEQFRLAYEEACQEVCPEQKNKEFNFTENIESSKEKSQLSTDHLDEIADKVLRAMSLDQYFNREEVDERFLKIAENYVDRIMESRRMQTKPGFVCRFDPDWSSLESFEDSYSIVGVSSEEDQTLRDSCAKTCKAKGCLRRPLVKNTTVSSTFSGTRHETYNRRTSRLVNLFGVVKTLFLMGCLLPFLIITYVTSILLELCFPSE